MSTNLRVAMVLILSATIGVVACDSRPSPAGPDRAERKGEPDIPFDSQPMALADTADEDQLGDIENAVISIPDGSSDECDAAKAWMLGWIQDHQDWLDSNGVSGQMRFNVTSLTGTLARRWYSGAHPHDDSDFSHTDVDPCVFDDGCDYGNYGISGNSGLFGHEGMYPGLDMHMEGEEQLQEWDDACEFAT